MALPAPRGKECRLDLVPRWRQPARRLGVALLLSWAVAFALSTQFLIQPFIWPNWSLEEIGLAWFAILRDRVIVASLIAVGVVLSQALPLKSVWLRTGALAVAIWSFTFAGELVVQALDSFNTHSILPGTLRWTLLSLSAACTWHLWRSSRETSDALAREALHKVSIEHQLARTQLTALRSQIEPHFLFNSLATIRHLQGADPQAGAHVLANFVDYLSRTLPMIERREVRLEDELALVRAYLVVMAVRMAGRLQTTIDVPDALCDSAVPSLAVATLVENAIKHGLSPSPQGGRLEIRATASGDELELSVTDTGVGLGAGGSGSGIGLSNVRARLATLYGRRGTLQVAANPGGGVRASLRLPRTALEHAA